MQRLWMIAVMLLVGVGCAAPQRPSFLVRPDRAVEARALPPDPGTEPLPSGSSREDFVEAVEVGQCTDAQGRPLPDAPRPCPARSGILSGEARAMRDGMYRIRYREMRIAFEADRTVWAAHRELYEGQLRRADEHIRSLEPNWWERNALPLGLAGGFIVGTITTIVIVSVLPPVVRAGTGP